MSYPFVAVDLFMHGSKLSELIQSEVPSITSLLIPNEFGVQRLETLEELEIQYLQVLAKPKRQTISHNRDLFIEALTFSRLVATRIKSVCPSSPSQAYRIIHSITILVHRTMAHM